MARREGGEEEVELPGGMFISTREIALAVALVVVLFILFRSNTSSIFASVQQALGKLGGSGMKPVPAQPAGKGGPETAFSVAALVGAQPTRDVLPMVDNAIGGADGIGARGPGGALDVAVNPSAHHVEAPLQRRVSDFSGGPDVSVALGRAANDFAASMVNGSLRPQGTTF